MKEVTYICDCCSRSYQNHDFLTNISIPCRIYNERLGSSSRGFTNIDICPDCLKAFAEVVSTKFADVYTDFGNHIHVECTYSAESVDNK